MMSLLPGCARWVVWCASWTAVGRPLRALGASLCSEHRVQARVVAAVGRAPADVCVAA
jgi:hypothetical protein